ncbi:MAG: ribosome small subunit-dependent GTPase A [Cyclobacteriaceae bacterium]|nr:ribosome small subunit-dependent GTPase A [Cyclobacteriaceae bacterium]
MEGRVIKSTGSWYEVIGTDGQHYTCRLQGKLRLEDTRSSNPVAVGDRVALLISDKDTSITEVLPRTNHILRQSVKRTSHSQVLAANVDQVLLVATLHQPRTSLGFIDRFLVSAESFRVPQILVFNKKDLWSDKDREHIRVLTQLYESLGVTCLSISAQEVSDIEVVRDCINGKTTLVAGHSGVGKSTLLNQLHPEIHQAIRAVSDVTDKGTHTTTFAEMFALDGNTFVIDTPGVKEWGLVEMEPQEISDYFPEMRDLRLDCKFGSRCLHLTEPACRIRIAVEAGHIATSRYANYVSMVTGEDNRK